MAVRYVSTTGSDSNDGLTPQTPWRTIQHAYDSVVFGTTIYAAPGTYAEEVVPAVSGVAGFPIRLVEQTGASYAVIDGTDHVHALYILSQSYLEFEGIGITNNGGDHVGAFAWGILIGSATALANAQGCKELHFTRCHVFDVNRPQNNVIANGIPVHFLSYGDETAGGTSTQYITFDNCLFEHCLIENAAGSQTTGYVACSGNVRDWAVRDCVFDSAGIPVVTFGPMGIDTGGNVLPIAKPNRPRKGVVLRNTFRDVPGIGFYCQAGHDYLVAQNLFLRCGWATGMNTETPGSMHDYDIARRMWVRDNLSIDTVNIDHYAGAWAVTYDDVSDWWLSNNTMYRSTVPITYLIQLLGGNQATPGKLGIIGDSWVKNNIASSPNQLMGSTLPAASPLRADNNLWASNGATPFNWDGGPATAFPYSANEDQHGHFQSYGTTIWKGPVGTDPAGFHLDPSSWANGHGSGAHTPSWYTSGLFGTYDPLVERDYYGDLYSVADVDVGADQLMSKPELAATLRIGAPGASYDIERVTADPRTAGLARDLGSLVEVIGAQGVITLQKHTTWDRGWRPPGGGPIYPLTASLFQAATKLANAKVYTLDQITGDVYSTDGVQDLVIQNTPTPQLTVGSRVGSYFDADADCYQADVNDAASSSFAWGCEVAIINVAGAAIGCGIMGRFLAGAVGNGYNFFWSAADGFVHIYVADGNGAHTINQAIGAVNIAAAPVISAFVQGQVDRTAGRVRARLSRGGAAIGTVDVAIGALGSLSAAGERFGFGSLPAAAPATNKGAWVTYGYYCQDATAEGADVLRDAAVGLGWEV